MTRIRFHPEAAAELAAASDWYEDRRGGLGEAFESAVDQALALALRAPAGGTRWMGSDARRWRVRKFPYQLIYIVEGTGLVAHDKRTPGYWADR